MMTLLERLSRRNVAAFTDNAFCSRRGPTAWLSVFGVALMGAIAVGTAIAVNTFRENALESGKQGLESAVLLLAGKSGEDGRPFAESPSLIS